MSLVALEEFCHVRENNPDDVIMMSSRLSQLGPEDYKFNIQSALQTGGLRLCSFNFDLSFYFFICLNHTKSLEYPFNVVQLYHHLYLTHFDYAQFYLMKFIFYQK